MAPSKKSYSARAETHKTAVGRKLLRIMAEKKSNLCLSIDLTDPDEVLDVIERLGPKICMVKTHIDILTFDSPLAIGDFVCRLRHLSKTHNFLIFEDRKFADIGNTVKHQYGGGIYKIVGWAHITNAHALPGEGIIKGLGEVISEFHSQIDAFDPDGWECRGLLLLEEMSSAGNLFNSAGYRRETVNMAKRNTDLVVGFISMGAVDHADDEDFISMTPGVNIASSGDGLGQQYKTPEYVVGERGSDVIIVGRGIYGSKDMEGTAEEYRRRGWEAYEKRIA